MTDLSGDKLFELHADLVLSPGALLASELTMPIGEKIQNRKGRRTAASAKMISLEDIPLAQPNRTEKPHKTLLELAAERNARHFGHQPSIDPSTGETREPKVVMKSIRPDGTFSQDVTEDEPLDDPIGPFGNAVFYSISLTMLHLTLDVLVHNQFAERIYWDAVTGRTLQTFPMLLTMVYMLHSRASTWWAQTVFLVTSVAAGCYLIYSSNDAKYLAVMQRAPPVGTLWVWSVLELRLEVALLGLATVGGYFWWGEYTIF